MNKLPIIDTNILARLITRENEELYDKAKVIVNSKKHLITQVIWAELIFLLTSYYKYSRAEALKLKDFFSLDLFEVEELNILNLSLDIYSKTKLHFADCYLAAKATLEKRSVSTFDKELEKYLKR